MPFFDLRIEELPTFSEKEIIELFSSDDVILVTFIVPTYPNRVGSCTTYSRDGSLSEEDIFHVVITFNTDENGRLSLPSCVYGLSNILDVRHISNIPIYFPFTSSFYTGGVENHYYLYLAAVNIVGRSPGYNLEVLELVKNMLDRNTVFINFYDSSSQEEGVGSWFCSFNQQVTVSLSGPILNLYKEFIHCVEDFLLEKYECERRRVIGYGYYKVYTYSDISVDLNNYSRTETWRWDSTWFTLTITCLYNKKKGFLFGIIDEALGFSEKGYSYVKDIINAFYSIEYTGRANPDWLGRVLCKCYSDGYQEGRVAFTQRRIGSNLYIDLYYDSLSGPTWYTGELESDTGFYSYYSPPRLIFSVTKREPGICYYGYASTWENHLLEIFESEENVSRDIVAFYYSPTPKCGI